MASIRIHKDEFNFTSEKPFKSGISSLDRFRNHVHSHNGLEIGSVCSGTAELLYNGTRHELGKNDVFFLDAVVPHWTYPVSDEPVQVIWIAVPMELVASFLFGRIDLRFILPFIATRSGLPPVLKDKSNLCGIIGKVNRFYKEKSLDWDMYANAGIHELMIGIASEILPALRKGNGQMFGNTHHIINAVLYVNSHFKDSFSLETLAKECCLSISRMSHLFTQAMNISPIEYRNQLRINHAVEKICTATGQSISAIAEDCGFQSMPYFYKAFKKYTGTNPNTFRHTAFTKGTGYNANKS